MLSGGFIETILHYCPYQGTLLFSPLLITNFNYQLSPSSTATSWFSKLKPPLAGKTRFCWLCRFDLPASHSLIDSLRSSTGVASSLLLASLIVFLKLVSICWRMSLKPFYFLFMLDFFSSMSFKLWFNVVVCANSEFSKSNENENGSIIYSKPSFYLSNSRRSS